MDCVISSDKGIIIFDWKTGQEYADHRYQREIYAAAYHCFNDVDTTIDVIHVYFDKKMNAVSSFKPEDIPEIRKSWEVKVEEMFNDKRLMPNPGFYCRNCHFRRDNGGPCQF